jgi:isocitrate dehydrogenase (NAD+)
MHQITLIPGDWIGPETSEAVKEILAAAGARIAWDLQTLETGKLNDKLLDSCRRNKVVLKGRTHAPREIGHLPPTIALRKELKLWSTVRPVKALPFSQAKFPNIDVVVIRETSEDIYSGFEHEVTDGVFEAVKVTTRSACQRIARYAFEYARANGRKRMTIVHKSNIMKKSDGMFLRTAMEISKEYPEIETNETIVDALCMWLVKNPYYYDVLLTLNLFGDIVSDLCSGLAGGITASPSASYGSDIVVFECLHGNAPELVGKDLANPIPLLNAATMMLDHLGEDEISTSIRAAIIKAGNSGVLTLDLGGSSKCSEITASIIGYL